MIRVVVSGAKGRMGTCVIRAVDQADDMQVAGGYDPRHAGEELALASGPLACSGDLASLIEQARPDVLVDFSQPDALLANVACALSHGVHVVTGTTGVPVDELRRSWEANAQGGARLFFAPNFTTGAVLMMQFAKAAAPFFPEAEVLEFHHCNKKDAPSGTAVRTAQIISEARGGRQSAAPGKETEIAGCEGARGALVEGVPVHSVRSMGYVASQEVVFGSMGQTLTIRHDSWDRTSYMPGVLLGIRSVGDRQGLIVGLENFME